MKEEKTIHEVAKDNDVHPTQVTDWKKTLAENIAGGFENSKRTKKEDFKRERERLHSKIGRLTVEVDFLEKIQTARPVNRKRCTEHPVVF